MNSKAKRIVDMFHAFDSLIEVSQSNIDGVIFDAILSKIFISHTYKTLGSTDAETRWMPFYPPFGGYFCDSLNVYAAIVLPTGYNEDISDEELYGSYDINPIKFDNGPSVGFIKLDLSRDFTINDLYNETIDAQYLVAEIFRINTDPGVMYTSY